MGIPRTPSPTRIEELLQILADACAQRLQGRAGGQRFVGLLARVGIDKSVEQRKLRTPRRAAKGAVPAQPAVNVAKVGHAAARKVREPISSHVFGSSPTTRV